VYLNPIFLSHPVQSRCKYVLEYTRTHNSNTKQTPSPLPIKKFEEIYKICGKKTCPNCQPIIISNSTNCYFVTSSAVEMQKLFSTALELIIRITNKHQQHSSKKSTEIRVICGKKPFTTLHLRQLFITYSETTSRKM